MSRVIRFRIRYERRPDIVVLLTLVALCAGTLAYLAWKQRPAAASAAGAGPATSVGMRQFYRTKDAYTANNADTACASGYHMASLWEILEPSALKYNTTLGGTSVDAGSGPPGGIQAWVRTGDTTSNGTNVPGVGNCDLWSSNSVSEYGTVARLKGNWSTAPDLHAWDVDVTTCNWTLYVWCVENTGHAMVFLPLIRR